MPRPPVPRLERLALGVTLLLAMACAADVPGPPPPAGAETAAAAPDGREFQKGIAFAGWWRGAYATPEADQALAQLAATGAGWVAIVVTGYQDTHASTAIRRDRRATPSDAELAQAIRTARQLGLRVMLKPHVDLSRDPERWRGDIGAAFADEAEWQAWFAAYRAFIDHYAALAQQNGVDQFCVGTELAATSQRDEDWRRVVAGVRERFAGPLTYASNHGGEEARITWWDAVDYIGVDAYYSLARDHEPSVDELKAAWVARGYLDTLAGLAARYRRPVLITEIGYRSADGAAMAPWRWQGEAALDLQEQADAYQAALDVLWGRPWLAGMYWWHWDADPGRGGPEDADFTPQGKPALEVLREFYRRPFLPERVATSGADGPGRTSCCAGDPSFSPAVGNATNALGRLALSRTRWWTIME